MSYKKCNYIHHTTHKSFQLRSLYSVPIELKRIQQSFCVPFVYFTLFLPLSRLFALSNIGLPAQRGRKNEDVVLFRATSVVIGNSSSFYHGPYLFYFVSM